MILGCFTDMMGHGGIQRLARHEAAALIQFGRSIHQPVIFFSMNDDVGQHTLSNSNETIHFRGFGKSRPAFIRACIAAAGNCTHVFFNHAYIAPIGLFLRIRNWRLKYAVAVHGIEVWEPMTFMRRLALQRSNVVIASAKFNELQTRKHQQLPATCRVEVVPNCFDPVLKRSASDDDTEWQSLKIKSPFVLCVCRINREDAGKRIDTLIEAWKKISAGFPDWTMIHVGSGTDRDRLASIAAPCGESFRFLGSLSDETLHRLYLECEFFVMPSAKEGFGIVFLEAMAHGKAVIGGDAGGTPDIVLDAETGYLVDPRNVGELADRMSRLMTSRSERVVMGNRGRQRLEDHFTSAEFLRRSLEVFATW